MHVQCNNHFVSSWQKSSIWEADTFTTELLPPQVGMALENVEATNQSRIGRQFKKNESLVSTPMIRATTRKQKND